jgi:SAM-dependent methyltransferase
VLSEAEKQVLIAVLELTEKNESPDRERLEKLACEYFRQYRVDWAGAFDSLADQGLLTGDGDGYSLTEQGQAQARPLRQARPALWYWYSNYYAAMKHSQAHAAFCERVYGKNLCQHGYMTMQQLYKLMEVANLSDKSRVLELGCGNGLVAETISDATQAHIHGVDYIPEAIRQAQERTQAKRKRLTFSVGDMNALGFAPNSFGTVVAVDTLYFSDLEDTIGQLKALLRPGGQIVTFYNLILWNETDDKTTLLPDRTPLADALNKHRLTFQTWDFTRAEYERSQLIRQIAGEFKAAFEAEGYLFLYENRMVEAEGNVKFFESGRTSRYLYRATGKE